jgi:hypothetical protein
MNEDKSSYGSGWLLGFLLSILGIIIAYAIGGDKVKRGSWFGLLFSFIIGSVIIMVYACQIAYLLY